jgi:chromosome segregation ATPase
MRYNLNWQKKYASLEEQYNELEGQYNTAVAARAEAEEGLEVVRAEKVALGREVDKVAAAMGKLEDKYAALEATAAQLRRVEKAQRL